MRDVVGAQSMLQMTSRLRADLMTSEEILLQLALLGSGGLTS